MLHTLVYWFRHHIIHNTMALKRVHTRARAHSLIVFHSAYSVLCVYTYVCDFVARKTFFFSLNCSSLWWYWCLKITPLALQVWCWYRLFNASHSFYLINFSMFAIVYFIYFSACFFFCTHISTSVTECHIYLFICSNTCSSSSSALVFFLFYFSFYHLR